MTRVRAELQLVAERVAEHFADTQLEPNTVSQAQIEMAIAELAHMPEAERWLSTDDYRLLIRLRSAAIKSPKHLLRFAP